MFELRTHPRLYGKDAHFCRVCHNTHGLIRKYKLDICRRCFRERAVLLGFTQIRIYYMLILEQQKKFRFKFNFYFH